MGSGQEGCIICSASHNEGVFTYIIIQNVINLISYNRLRRTIPAISCVSSDSCHAQTETVTSPPPSPVVDSPRPALLHFVLSSLSSWREGGKNTHTVPLKTPFPQPSGRETILPGCLLVSTFQWSSVQISQSLLTLRTTGTKGAILSLPPG